MKNLIFTISVILMAVFSYAEKDGHSFTIIEEGKHGPITFIITIAADGTINNIEVLESKEIKGAKINKKRFLKQFVGKSSKDPLKLGKDIDAVAGATVSSNAAVRAARKALVLWGELFSEKDNSKR